MRGQEETRGVRRGEEMKGGRGSKQEVRKEGGRGRHLEWRERKQKKVT